MVGGEGDDQLCRSGRGAIAGCHCRVPLWCAVVGGKEGDDQLWGDVVPLLGAIVGCHSGVLWLGGVDVVQGAIVMCYGGGGEGNDQLWGSGRGAIAGCQSVSYLPSIFKATNFTQIPKKTAMNFVLSFLQTLHCFLH